MGVVYEAIDTERGHPVALKTLLRASPSAIYRFKQEFRALADVSHANLVSLFELVKHNELWFFTMELVPGVPFLEWCRRAGKDEPEPATDMLPTVVVDEGEHGPVPLPAVPQRPVVALSAHGQHRLRTALRGARRTA